jgi:hypothetical protein
MRPVRRRSKIPQQVRRRHSKIPDEFAEFAGGAKLATTDAKFPNDVEDLAADQSNLEQAGFKDIQMMPSSFIVRARDKNNIMMVISPDSMTAITPTGKTSPDDNTIGQGSGTPPR